MPNAFTDLTKQGIQPGFRYPARVIDNNDPQKLGKIRARVQDLHNDIPDDHLPWAIPKGFSHISGAGPETGSFSVPEVGTQVDLVFPQGSPYHAEYYPYDVTEDTRPQEVQEDYPFTHLFFRFLTETKAFYNRKKKLFTIKNVKDADIENTGNVVIKVGENAKITVSGNGEVTIEGNLKVNVNGRTHITCPSTTIDGDVTINGILTVN